MNFKKGRIVMALFVCGLLFSLTLAAQTGTLVRPLKGVIKPVPVPVPAQVQPADGTEFHQFPRIFVMRWQAIEGCTYEVQIDCLHCRQAGKWDSEVGAPATLGNLTVNAAQFTFWGDNQGRWRVRAMKGNLSSSWSPWWNFSFKTGQQTSAAPDLTIAISQCPAAAKAGQELGASFVVQATNNGAVDVSQVAVDIVLKNAPRCGGPVDWAVYSPNYSNGVLLKGGREFIDLKAGQTLPVKLNGTNAIPADTPAGTYYLCAVIDAGNKVAESNENNNCGCCPLVIEGAQTPGYQPCGITLTSLTQTSGVPGDVFGMIGTWGSAQGTKIPCINKGSMHRLEVLSWGPTALKVRIPAGLEPGLYRVGVYCNELSQGGSYSSGWIDFTINRVK